MLQNIVPTINSFFAINEGLVLTLPDFSKLNKNHFLFTPYEIGGEWIATENNRRDNFSKRFKTVVKDHFKLDATMVCIAFDTFIIKLYREVDMQTKTAH